MADFDAEFHLRCHAEDEFGAEDGDDRSAAERARALVVLGLLPLERARGILTLYRRAAALRRHGGYYDGSDDDDPDGVGGDQGARVVLIDQPVQLSFGTVHLRFATFTARRTRLAVKIDFGSSGRRSGFRHGPPEITVTDDRGATAELSFGGGGGQRTWTGHFSSHETLSATTAWLEVEGQRIELQDRPSSATVSVHDVLEETGPGLDARAARYVEHCLRRGEYRHRGSALPAVLDTLVASGSLPPDSPVLTGARAVQEARSTNEVPDAQGLPEPWRSAFDPVSRKRRGPKGDAPISVLTPVFDGVRLTVFVLSSRRERFEVELDVVGVPADRLSTDDHESPVTFSAVDDLGNHYLGHTQEWQSDGSEFGGTVAYEPALDPAARSVALEFDTASSRAVVQVPLPWGKPS